MAHTLATTSTTTVIHSLDPASTTSVNGTRNATEIEELLLTYLGERQRDLPSGITLTIVYSFIFVSGIIGNLCTCAVIARNSYMQTTTNYYLFGLALSDVLMLILGLPTEVYSIWEAYPWRFGEPFCIFKSLLTEMMSYASVLTITAFTIERYMAICHPLLAHKFSDKSRAVKIIVSLWVISLCCSLPYPIHTRTFYYVRDNVTNEPFTDSLMCNIPLKWLESMRPMFQVSTFLFFITPMTVITVMYILIALTIRQAGKMREESCQQGSHSAAAPRKVVLKMLFAVVVAFFICWAPFNAQRLMTVYVAEWEPWLMDIQSQLFYVSGVLYYFGSTVNPILYNVMSKRYRQAFKETMCCCCWKRSSRNTTSRGCSEYNHTVITRLYGNSHMERGRSGSDDDQINMGSKRSIATNDSKDRSLFTNLLKKKSNGYSISSTGNGGGGQPVYDDGTLVDSNANGRIVYPIKCHSVVFSNKGRHCQQHPVVCNKAKEGRTAFYEVGGYDEESASVV